MIVLQPVLILFFLIAIGFAAQKSKLLASEARQPLTAFVLNLGLPLFILHNMNFAFDRKILINSLAMLLLSAVTYVVMMLISLVYAKHSKLSPEKLPAYQFGMVFSNVGFMGYPLIGGLFGPEAVFYASIFNIAFETFIWTYGVSIFRTESKLNLKNILTPNLIALILGVTLYILNFSWPSVISNGIELVGRTATPISMIVIGMMLAEVHFKDMISDIKPLLLSVYRLVIIPALAIGIYWLLGLRGLNLAVPSLLMTTPVAAYGAILASHYKKDFREATKLVMVSTLLSLITIPLWVTIILKLSGLVL